jgi:hypothetical protein
MRGERTALVEALTGRFDAHHGELARILLGQIDRLDIEIAKVTERIGVLLDQIDPPWPPQTLGGHRDASVIDARLRLAETPGINTESAQLIIAEIGLDERPQSSHLSTDLTLQQPTSMTRARLSWAAARPATARRFDER